MRALWVCLALAIASSSSAMAEDSAPPAGLTPSSAEGVHHISTLDHLWWVSNKPENWSQKVLQVAPSDAGSTRGAPCDQGWRPIADIAFNPGEALEQAPPAPSVGFSGRYDGSGHADTGLFINQETGSRGTGLFGHVWGGEIRNLRLLDVANTGRETSGTVLGRDYVRRVVGITQYTHVDEIFVDAVVTGESDDDLLKRRGELGLVPGNGRALPVSTAPSPSLCGSDDASYFVMLGAGYGGVRVGSSSPALSSVPTVIWTLGEAPALHTLQATSPRADGAFTVTASTVPDAPTIDSAVAGYAQVEVAFTPPADNGGQSISNYDYSLDNGGTWTPFNPAITAGPALIIGLSNNQTYAIRLRAVSGAGAGAASEMVEATPRPARVVISELASLRFDNYDERGGVQLFNGVTFPNGPGVFSGPGFSASFGSGDEIVIRVEPKAGSVFAVYKHPDATAQGLRLSAVWQAGSDTTSNFPTPTIRFENPSGVEPEVTFRQGSLSNNGLELLGEFLSTVTGDFTFSAVEISFTVPHALNRVKRTYASVTSSASPSFSGWANGAADLEERVVFAILGPPARLVLLDSPTDLAAGETREVRVAVVDAAGNRVLGDNGRTINLTTTDAAGSVSSTATTANGFATLSVTGVASGELMLLTAATGLTSATATLSVLAGPPAQVTVAAGNEQSATVGTPVAIPPSVRVTDAQGNPVSGVDVVFAVTSGGGVVAPASVVTGADGVAAVSSWSLGSAAGANMLGASVSGSDFTTSFTATATTALTSFSPTSATAGAVVTLLGSDLSAVTGVQFGGVEAFSYTVVSESEIQAVVAYGSSGSVSITTAGASPSLLGFTFISPSNYDFNVLPIGSVEGVDGWRTVPKGNSGASLQHVIVIPAVTAVGQNAAVVGHDGSRALRFPHGGAGIGSLATRVNNANFSTLPILADDGNYVIEFEMQHPCWGGDFGLGYDADGNGDLDEASEIGLRLRITNCNDSQRRLFLPDGSSVNAAHALGAFNRYQILIDRAANDGAGAVSVYTRNLTSDGPWIAIDGLQAINAGFDGGAGRRNPANWNAMLFRSESWDPSSLLDNISFRKVIVSARSLTFAPTLVGESASDSLTISGTHLSGNLTATLSGDFTFSDGSQTVTDVEAGAQFSIRFAPSAAGERTGALTLLGDDHAKPILIPLAGVATEPYFDLNTDGGGWLLVAYGADARLASGVRLNESFGSYEPLSRTDRATLDGVASFQAGGEVAISWNRSGFPTGGLASYDHAIAFPLPAASSMTLSAASEPPVGPAANQFSRVGTSVLQSLVSVRNLVGDAGLPAEMFLRNQTFGVNYGNSYGLVWSPSNNQLDWTPDSQPFAAVYFGRDLTSPPSGYVTPSGTANGYVPSTMAIWVRPARVSILASGSRFSVDRSSLVADGVDAVTLTVELRDVYGNRIERAGVPVRFSSTDGVMSAEQPVLSDATGSASVQLRATTVGGATVSAEVDPEAAGEFVALLSGSPLTLTFGAGPAALLEVVAGDGLTTSTGELLGLMLSSFDYPRASGFGPGADVILAEPFRTGAAASWVTAAAFSVTGVPGTLTADIRADAAGLPGDVIGTLGTATLPAIVSGEFELVAIEGQGAVALAAETPYWLTIRGSGGDPIYQVHSQEPVLVAGLFSRPVGVSSHRLPASGGDWSASASNVVHALYQTPLVRVTDATGNPVAGEGVVFSIAGGGGVLGTGALTAVATSDEDGLVAAPRWRLGTTAGPQGLQATLIRSSDVTTTFTAIASAGLPVAFEVLGSSGDAIGPQSAGVEFGVRIRALDALGNVASDFDGAVTLASNGALVAAPLVTAPFVAGLLANQPVSFTDVGTFTLSVSSVSPPLSSTSDPFEVQAGAVAQMLMVAGDDQSAMVGTAVQVAPAVRVVDAFGNPVSGVDVVFAVVAGGGAVSDAVLATNAAGEAAVGSWTLGPVAGGHALTATLLSDSEIVVRFSATAILDADDAASLSALEERAASLAEEDYTPESWEALRVAVALSATTTAEVAVKVEALRDALAALIFAATPELQRLLELASAWREPDLAAVAWGELQALLALPETTNAEAAAKVALLAAFLAALPAREALEAPTGLRLGSRGASVVVLFDPMDGADGYAYLVSPSDVGWSPQPASDRGLGEHPNALLRLVGLESEATVEVFVRGEFQGVRGPLAGPLRIIPEVVSAPLVVGRVVADEAVFVAEPVAEGVELVFEYEVANDGDSAFANLWVRAVQVPGVVTGLALRVDRGVMREFDVLPNHWYWEGVNLLPGEVGRIVVVVRMLEVP